MSPFPSIAMPRIATFLASTRIPHAAAALVLAASASAALAQTSDDARARYTQERAHCMSDTAQDAQATCLREATNALAAARAGQLSDPGSAVLADNALQRCAVFRQPDDRAECVRRMQSPASGSVSGGGLLRESVTTTTVVPQ